MTPRLLPALGCVVLSLVCVWLVDPGSRTATAMGRGALWGAAGVLVVWSVRWVTGRRTGWRGGDRVGRRAPCDP
jgi:uncharacterized membrane protein YqjE